MAAQWEATGVEAPIQGQAKAAQDDASGGVRPLVAWTAVFVLALMYGLAFVDRQIISLLVKPIRHDLGISDFQISLLQGFSFALLYSLGGLPLGFAADRFSRRWVIFFGVFVWALSATACGLVHGFPALLVARVLVGMGEAALAPAAYSMLADLFPPRKLTFALSAYAVGATAGSSMSLVWGAAAIKWFEHGMNLPVFGHLQPWQAAFVITGAPGILLSFLIFAIPEPKRSAAHRMGDATWRALFRFIGSRWGFFTCHIAGFACILTMAYAHLAWAPTFLNRIYGWPIPKVALLLAGFSFVTGALSMLSSGRVVDAMARRGITDAHFRYYCYATLVLIVAGGTAYYAPNPWLFFLLAGFAAFALNMAAIAASAIQIVTPPVLRGRMSALYLMISSLLAMTLGPSTVATFTTYVFKSDKAIGAALSTTYLLFAPIALLAFFLGLKPMRRAVELARAS